MKQPTKAIGREKEAKIITRPPVVVLLGHVDHGKTTLLDAVASSKFAKGEFGEITQGIRAAEVDAPLGKITFIDTPGHSFFTNLRGEGARFADIAALVVSATEGVREQTVESIKLVQEAKIPMICVISKIDLPEANVAKVITELASVDIVTERTGGQIPVVETSALRKSGIDDFIQNIAIAASFAELKADLAAPATGFVLESYFDKKVGPISQIIVKDGVLRRGTSVIVDGVSSKIRAIFDQEGKAVDKIQPSQPARILGFEKIVAAGTKFFENDFQRISPEPPIRSKQVTLADRELVKKQFGIILKTDSVGTKDAVLANLPKDVVVVEAGVGQITGSDVELAEASGAKIFGFNVNVSPEAARLLKNRGDFPFQSKLIYELIDEIKRLAAAGFKLAEKVLGTAKVLRSFQVDGLKIAGCKVTEGFLETGAEVSVLRGEKIIVKTKIASLKTFAKSVTKVRQGAECGVGFTPPVDFQVGDVLKFVA